MCLCLCKSKLKMLCPLPSPSLSPFPLLGVPTSIKQTRQGLNDRISKGAGRQREIKKRQKDKKRDRKIKGDTLLGCPCSYWPCPGCCTAVMIHWQCLQCWWHLRDSWRGWKKTTFVLGHFLGRCGTYPSVWKKQLTHAQSISEEYSALRGTPSAPIYAKLYFLTTPKPGSCFSSRFQSKSE